MPSSGGVFLARAAKGVSLAGAQPKTITIIQFPTVDDAIAFDSSPAYTALKPLRDKSSNWRSYVVEGLPKQLPDNHTLAQACSGDGARPPRPLTAAGNFSLGSIVRVCEPRQRTVGDADWRAGRRRQVEFRQWLLRGRGLRVSDRAWFVRANGIRGDAAFDDVLRFRTRVIPYDGSDAWVEPALRGVADCLASGSAPRPSPGCAFCDHVARASAVG